MLSFLTMIIVSIISSILFSALFRGLNQSMLRLFIPIQKLTDKLKRKKLYSNLNLIIFIIISAFFRTYYNLNDIIYGISLGFFFTLNEIIFEEIPTNPES